MYFCQISKISFFRAIFDSFNTTHQMAPITSIAFFFCELNCSGLQIA